VSTVVSSQLTALPTGIAVIVVNTIVISLFHRKKYTVNHEKRAPLHLAITLAFIEPFLWLLHYWIGSYWAYLTVHRSLCVCVLLLYFI